MCSLLSNVALEELDYTGQSSHGKLVPTGMNVGHKLGAVNSGLTSFEPNDSRLRLFSLQESSRQLNAHLLENKTHTVKESLTILLASFWFESPTPLRN